MGIGSTYGKFHLQKPEDRVDMSLPHFSHMSFVYLCTCPAKNQAGCIERVVHHSHENKNFYLFKIAINEKCQKPKLTVKVIMVAMATAV